jgi:colanic acid/amylovoran biosynthesis glycosyltransferase
MVNSAPKVAHILIPYLRKTETFIYDRLIRHSRYQPFILTDEPVMNSDMFPFSDTIHTLADKTPRIRKIDTVFKKALHVSPFFMYVLKREAPAVIHAHFGPVGAAAAMSAKLLGIPLIVSFYGIDASELLESAEYRKEYRKLFGIAAIVSVLSGEMGERLVRAGCPPGKIRVHHLAVDTNALKPCAKMVDANRPFRIVSAGRFVPKKGMSLLVESFEILAKKGIDAELFLFGDGPLEAEVKKQVTDKKLGGRIRFFGHQKRGAVLAAMRAADVFALFSVTGPNGDCEGTPTVLIEAGALGLPSVSTRHAGIPEVIVDGRTGLLADENDVESFASQIEQLAASPELRGDLGRAARDRIAAEYDIRKVMSAIEYDYDSIASKK